eukprot:TRINITY_DN2929_c0_g1_i1.p1 TRINITY_DN2929_c0_g1~~TRINITY_DN2929_c0_g1_i1.p1  ORF type:complete len:155 (-),score=7.08 TRINITY_DN2929_c0_g1_i1:38-502(-)
MKQLLVLFALLAIGHSALTFCNKAGYSISASVGFHEGDTWSSRGWYLIDSGDCSNVITGDLNDRFYYAYAMSTGGHVWSGSYTFCTLPTKYYIYGDMNCGSRGYNTTGFSQVDVGNNLGYTLNFITTLDGTHTFGQESGETIAKEATMKVADTH